MGEKSHLSWLKRKLSLSCFLGEGGACRVLRGREKEGEELLVVFLGVKELVVVFFAEELDVDFFGEEFG